MDLAVKYLFCRYEDLSSDSQDISKKWHTAQSVWNPGTEKVHAEGPLGLSAHLVSPNQSASESSKIR